MYRLLDAGSRCYDLRLPDDWSAVYGDQKCTTALHLATSLDIVKRLLTEKGGYKKYKATGDVSFIVYVFTRETILIALAVFFLFLVIHLSVNTLIFVSRVLCVRLLKQTVLQ